MFLSVVWPIAVGSTSAATILGAMTGIPTLDTYKVFAALLWLMNTTYILFFARDNIYVLGVALGVLLMHAVFVMQRGKDHILMTSALFCVIVGMNLWGVDEYELLALTLFVEISTWITTYFVMTITDQS